MSKFTRVLAVAGISGALAIGAAGVAQASPDHGRQAVPDKAQVTRSHDRNGNSRDKGRSGHDKNRNSKDRNHGKSHK